MPWIRVMASWDRLVSRLAFDFFFLGTAMSNSVLSTISAGIKISFTYLFSELMAFVKVIANLHLISDLLILKRRDVRFPVHMNKCLD